MEIKNIEYVKEDHHLGVILDEKGTFRSHLLSMGNEANSAFQAVARQKWGLDHRTLKIIYKGVVGGIM